MPAPAPRRPIGDLLFRSPDPVETSPLSDPTSPTTGPGTSGPASPPDGSPSPSDGRPDEPSDPHGGARSSSKGSSAASPLSRKVLDDTVQAGVMMAGTLAHEKLTRDELERDYNLWLADDADAEAIGKPLAAIAARRGGVAGSLGNPDVVDGLAAMVGVAVYVSKQVTRLQAIRRQRKAERRLDAGTPQAGDGGREVGA